MMPLAPKKKQEKAPPKSCPGGPCPCPDIEALRDSEKKYRLLAENAVEVIWTMDLSGKFTYVSPSSIRLSGYTPEESMALPLSEKMTPGSLEAYMQAMAEYMALPPDKRPISKTMQLEMVRKGGRRIWVEVTVRVTTDEKGGLLGFQGSTRDISEQKRAEQALRESERKYRLLAENSIEVIWTMDMAGNCTYVSPSIERISGYTVEEAMKHRLQDRMTPSSYEFFKEEMEKYLAIPPEKRHSSRTLRLEMLRKDKTSHWAEFTVQPIKDEQGRQTGFQGICRDISDHLRSSEALADSERRFQTILRALPDMVVGLDAKGRVTFYHTPDPELLLMKPEEFMDKNVFEVMSPHLKGLFMNAMEKNRRNEVTDVEFCMDRNGHYKCYSAKVSPIISERGYEGSVAVVRDISEKKLSERNVRRGLIKFDLKAGGLYFVKEVSSHVGRDAFKELVDVGYQGIWFTREPPPKAKEAPGLDLPRRYWLTQRGTEDAVPPDPARIEEIVTASPVDCAILLENLEYIQQSNGFEATLALVQHLRDLAHARAHVMLVSLDPMFMSARQLKTFEKEGRELTLKTKQRLDEDLGQILFYIYEQNMSGRKPKYSDVSSELNVSKPTTRKRIARLVHLGLLFESTHGKSKVLETTEKGRAHYGR